MAIGLGNVLANTGTVMKAMDAERARALQEELAGLQMADVRRKDTEAKRIAEEVAYKSTGVDANAKAAYESGNAEQIAAHQSGLNAVSAGRTAEGLMNGQGGLSYAGVDQNALAAPKTDAEMLAPKTAQVKPMPLGQTSSGLDSVMKPVQPSAPASPKTKSYSDLTNSERLYLRSIQAKKDGKYDIAEEFNTKFKAAIAEDRSKLASDALAKLHSGDASGFEKLYENMNDGVDIVKTVRDPKSGEFSFQLNDGNQIKMTQDALISRVIEYGKPGSELGMEADRLKQIHLEGIKTDQKIRESNSTGQTALNLANANKANGNGEGTSKYKVEMAEVSSALGTPAVDARGKPVSDPISGKQMVNRNPEEERKFFEWMQKSGIKDTNEALAAYLPTYNKKTGAPTAAPQGKRDWSKY